MIKTFIQEHSEKWNELIQVDIESGKVKIYSVDKGLDFPFSEYYTTLQEMGYTSLKQFLKRMKATKKEIDTDRQIAKEITGLLKLAKHRAEHNKHICLILNDGTKYNNIVERLKTYGMTEAEALKKIDYFINHNIERHNVKVTFENGNMIETSINGTVEEIGKYYRVGSIFNIGTVADDLQKVVNLEFVF